MSASFYDQYNQIAANAAAQYGVPQNVFFGMISQESSWNPYAVGDGGAAIGFGQLHAGAASDVGANRFDPTSNLYGAAAYLGKQISTFGGDITKGLAAYNQGAGNWQNGLDYAKSVLSKAGEYAKGEIPGSEILAGVASLNPNLIMQGVSDQVSSWSGSFFEEIKNWIIHSAFFTRMALAILAFLLILGALMMYKPQVITTAAKTAA